MRVNITTWASWFYCLMPALFACPVIADAQDKIDKPPGYPNRPIRIIVAVAAGAGGDANARMVGQLLAEGLEIGRAQRLNSSHT
mgnify:CR=1 FL=1